MKDKSTTRILFSAASECGRLNADILEMTMLIHAYCPELSKYLEEMTVIGMDAESDEIQVKSLRLYFDRLYAMMAGYASHVHAQPKWPV